MSFSDTIQWPRAVTARRRLGTVPPCQPQKHEWLVLAVATTNGFKSLYEVCVTCGQTPSESVDVMVAAELEREAAAAKSAKAEKNAKAESAKAAEDVEAMATA